MSLNVDKINNAIKRKVARVVQELSTSEGIRPEQVLTEFMGSKTYELLNDNESLLCLESINYILDMYQDELDKNWDEWLRV